MKVRSRICLFFSVWLCTGISGAALAKHESQAKDENVAVVIGQAGESYPIVGTGGIRVSGGHHGFFSSNMKSSEIQIDGSDVSASKFNPLNETADFTASPGSAYFVSQTCVCTLSTAVGFAGQEIVVCNAGTGGTISYKTGDGAALGGGLESTPPNSRTGKVDRFISDGKFWYRE